jgi:hypothetical protein
MATAITATTNAFQPVGHGLSGNLKGWWGKYTYASAAVINDTIDLCKIPKNSLVLWGFLSTDDIDTGTETLEIDVGFTANGGGAATLTTNDGTVHTNNNSGSASATAFVDSGVMTGDAITDLIPAGMNWRPFKGVATGPMFFSEETQVRAKITAAANATGTGTIYVCLIGVAL